MSDKRCENCGRRVPDGALSFSNEFAIEAGWCSWACLERDLGREAAYDLLRQIRVELTKQEKSH